MSIELSPHAKKRLKMRGINEKALYARKVSTLEVVFMKIKYYPDSDILEKCLSSIQNLDHVRGSNSPRQEQCR